MPSGQPLKPEAAALHERGAAFGSILTSWALVQTFGINATKRSGTLRGSCGENSIPDPEHPPVATVNSIQLAYINQAISKRTFRIGAGILRVAKAPDPDACKLDETRQRRGDHRREMARYIVAMLQMLLEAQVGRFGVPDRDLCFVADVRLGERIGPAPDHTIRLRAIRAHVAKSSSCGR
jgi:hypothetical protein